MRYTLFCAGFVVASILATPSLVAAGTITLSPTNAVVAPGETVTATLTVHPDDDAVYTVRANLTFSETVLEVTGFSFAPNWVPLTQSGYDTTDNANGVLIKSAGYPGGITTPQTFGTVTFRTHSAGDAEAALTQDSVVLNSESEDTYTQSSNNTMQATVAAEAEPDPEPEPESETPPVSQSVADDNRTDTTEDSLAEVSPTTTATTTAPEENFAASSGQLAQTSAASAVPLWVRIVALILVAGAAAYYLLVYRRRRKV